MYHALKTELYWKTCGQQCYAEESGLRISAQLFGRPGSVDFESAIATGMVSW